MSPPGYTLRKNEPKPEPDSAKGQSSNLKVGAAVNVYPETFNATRFAEEVAREKESENLDKKGGEAGGESKASYVDTAREATVVQSLADGQVEVQYDDGAEEVEVVNASRVQVCDLL